MGRFLKVADVNRPDFMYDLPENLMMKAIDVADTQNQALDATIGTDRNALSIPYHPNDEEYVKQWASSWNNKINSAADNLNQDRANWRQYMNPIKDLGRQLETDLTSGDASRIIANAKARQSGIKQLDDWREENMKDPEANKGIINSQYQAYKASAEQNYANGFKNPDGTYNTYKIPDPVRYTDANKELDKWATGMKENGYEVSKDATNGRYIVTNKTTGKELSAAEVASNSLNFLMGNDRYMAYAKDAGKYKYGKPLSDANGKIIKPFDVDAAGNIKFNYDSPMAAPIAAITGKLDFKDQTSSSATKADPYGEEAQRSSDALNNALTIGKQKHQFDQDDKTDDTKDWKEKMQYKGMLDFYGDPTNNRNADGSWKTPPPELLPKDNTNPLVTKVGTITPSTSNSTEDIAKVQTLKGQASVAAKSGDWATANSLNAQAETLNQNITASNKAANDILTKYNFTPQQIAEYNDYQNNKARYTQDATKFKGVFDGTYVNPEVKAWQQKVGEKNLSFLMMATNSGATPEMKQKATELFKQYGMPPAAKGYSASAEDKGEFDWYNNHMNKVASTYDKMEGLVQKAKHTFYENQANSTAQDMVGIALTGTRGDAVKNQVYNFIDIAPNQATLYDMGKSDPSGITMEKLLDGKSAKDRFDIQSVVSHDGTVFTLKDKKSGKMYTMQPRGENNLEGTVVNTYKDITDPAVQRFTKQIANTNVKAIIGQTEYMAPGQHRTMYIPDGSGGQIGLNVEMHSNNTYSATLWDANKQQWVPIYRKGKTLNYTDRQSISTTISDKLIEEQTKQ